MTSEPDSDAAPRLALTAAGYDFPRVGALFDGRVEIEGCRSRFEPMRIGDMNTNVFDGPQSLDVTEIGLHPFVLAFANENFRDYSLLPIFPLRQFRHKSIFIRTDRGIDSPADLRGRTVATPGYSSTSLTWIRGMLQHEYSVRPEDVDWVIASGDSSAGVSGATSQQERVLPQGVSARSGPEGMDESDLLVSGEADALFHAVEPRAYVEGDPLVRRIFGDHRAAERAYFASTGIFPIMHAVAVRTALVREHPWLAKAIFEAFSSAKRAAYEAMSRIGWAADMLPWYGKELEDTRSLMGDNFYSYGIEADRTTLEALLTYSFEQGLSSRKLTVEELFDPSSLELSE